MPRFSRFTPFGHLRFSSKPSHGELIYGDMVRSLGDGKNYTKDPESLAMARVYANAMLFARAFYTVERAGSQFRPLRAVELLPTLEREYGIVPEADQTIPERQRILAATARIPRGARRDNVVAVMTELLGADFIAYLTVDKSAAVVSHAAPADVGVYVKPGTPRSVFRTSSAVSILGTPKAVLYAPVVGASPRLTVGDRIVIDAGHLDRIEAVTVLAATTQFVVATFTKPHDPGVLVATGRHPHLMSTKRHDVFVLSSAAVRSGRIRGRVEKILRRLLRGVSTWSLTEETSPGAIGPFTIGESTIGITALEAGTVP
jgi:hypothetical protein